MIFPCKDCGKDISVDDRLLEPDDDFINVVCCECWERHWYSLVRIREIPRKT